MHDVAVAAGVSRTTASFALSKRGSSSIPHETQEHVRRIAQEMGYQPNLLARSLGGQKTDTIGLMLPKHSNSAHYDRNPFYFDVMHYAEQIAHDAGYRLIMDTTPVAASSYLQHGKLSGWPLDGILMWSYVDEETAALYLGSQAKGLPVVYVDANFRRDDNDCVTTDIAIGARQAVEHVIARGYQRIAFLSSYWYDGWINETRYATYESVCREAGVSFERITPKDNSAISETVGARDLGMAIAEYPASKRPDALLCFNDMTAFGAIHGLRRGGLKIPDDIAVVGFDGIEEGLHFDRPLTSVVIPVETVCRRALEILFQRMDGNGDPSARQVTISAALRIGETT